MLRDLEILYWRLRAIIFKLSTAKRENGLDLSAMNEIVVALDWNKFGILEKGGAETHYKEIFNEFKNLKKLKPYIHNTFHCFWISSWS